MPFESSMRFGCGGLEAGRGGSGGCCQPVAWAAARKFGARKTDTMRYAARTIGLELRRPFMGWEFIARLPDRAKLKQNSDPAVTARRRLRLRLRFRLSPPSDLL